MKSNWERPGTSVYLKSGFGRTNLKLIKSNYEVAGEALNLKGGLIVVNNLVGREMVVLLF